MRKILFLTGLYLLCFSYGKAEVDDGQDLIGTLTFENFPTMDGSTSTQPLNMLIACKLLGVSYEWSSHFGEWRIFPTPDWDNFSQAQQNFFWNETKVSQTHGAFMNLIDKNVDIILTHRTISPDEKVHAEEVGVTLIETPIALDGFIFVVNRDNPVKSLTVNQVQDIYTGRITNWKQVGGNDETIIPYARPRNSGSEEIMRSLVMQGLETAASLPEIQEIVTMAGTFLEITNEQRSICYSFNYYKEIQLRMPDETVPKIAINGVFPTEATISNRTYPFVTEVYVTIRSDLDENSTAYKIYEWLQTEAGQKVVAESGYLPINGNISSTAKISDNPVRLFPNPVTNELYISGLMSSAQIILTDISGRIVLSKQVTANEAIRVAQLPKGFYIVTLSTNNMLIQRKILKK